LFRKPFHVSPNFPRGKGVRQDVTLGEELPRGLTVGRLEPNRDVENLETDFFRRAEEIPGRRPAVVVFAEVEHEDEIVVKANI